MTMKQIKRAEEKTTPEVRKFQKDDPIPCRSLTSGELMMEGKKSKELYRWADIDDIQDVQYEDLVYDVRAAGNSSFALYPRFVVMDEDFIEQNPKLNEAYAGVYSYEDINEMFKMPAAQMKETIKALPNGIKNTIRTLASTAIRSGELDSVQKIAALDDIFGTQMLKMLADN